MPLPVPAYPDSRPLELDDRPLIRQHLRVLQPAVSELSFANLYLFRHVHQYRLSLFGDSLILLGCGYSKDPYFLPPLSGRRGETARALLEKGHLLYGADEFFIKEFLHDYPALVLSDRDNDDYLYLRSDLSELPGTHFHKKRNRIRYFTARHRYRVEPYTANYQNGALQLLDEWTRVHADQDNSSLAAESAAAREGIQLADELGLTGVVVLVNDTVAAFALGELLNDTTAACHFEKVDPFLEGLGQLVNREFSRALPVDCLYINREQDLGEAGLRAAKLSYHPLAMIRKFRVRAASANERHQH